MKKLALTLALLVALPGCAQLKNLETALVLGTASVSNPVTPDRLDQMEAAVKLVFIGLNTWKQTCAQGLIPPACKTEVAAVQVYTRQIPPYLNQLRAFVRDNDQINATVAFNQLTSIIGTVKSQAALAGQTVGG